MDKELIERICKKSGILGVLSGAYSPDETGVNVPEFYEFAALIAEECAKKKTPHDGSDDWSIGWIHGQVEMADAIRATFPAITKGSAIFREKAGNGVGRITGIGDANEFDPNLPQYLWSDRRRTYEAARQQQAATFRYLAK